MSIGQESTQELQIPKGYIVFISGVPGCGKTTVSYQLLRRFMEFRIIEETDLIREVLLGYNHFLKTSFGEQFNILSGNVNITDHTKLLSFDEAKEQCNFMKESLRQIVGRQQRKGIASIINGVHIIPEILKDITEDEKVIFINLYINRPQVIYERIMGRDPESYMLGNIPLIFQTNIDLYQSTAKISAQTHHVFNLDVTDLTVNETVEQIARCISSRLHYFDSKTI